MRRHFSNRPNALPRNKLDIFSTISCQTMQDSGECTASNRRDHTGSSSLPQDDTNRLGIVALRKCRKYEFALYLSNPPINQVIWRAPHNHHQPGRQIDNYNIDITDLKPQLSISIICD